MSRGILGLAVTAALVVAVPATASASATICDPLSGGALLAGSKGLATGIAGRGGDVREPVLDEVHTDLPAAAKNRAPKNFKATMPVYVHVITDGAIGELTDAQIAAQIRVLNRTFAGGEGGASTGSSSSSPA